MFNRQGYDDIINLPHHVSVKHPHIPRRERAAQFAPFAALTGYDAEIDETARLTGEKIEPDDDTVTRIDTCLQILIDNAELQPLVHVTFFVPDEKKLGGKYIKKSGNFRRYDESDRNLIFTDGMIISLEDVLAIDGEIFERTLF